MADYRVLTNATRIGYNAHPTRRAKAQNMEKKKQEHASAVIDRWLAGIESWLPDEISDSDEWQQLLLIAAETDSGCDRERLNIMRDWLFSVVLPTIQPTADRYGFGETWQKMCEERTTNTAEIAWSWAEGIARGARAAARAAWASAAAARSAADSVTDPAADTAWVVEDAVWAARMAASIAATDAVWKIFDPINLLSKLINCKEDR